MVIIVDKNRYDTKTQVKGARAGTTPPLLPGKAFRFHEKQRKWGDHVHMSSITSLHFVDYRPCWVDGGFIFAIRFNLLLVDEVKRFPYEFKDFVFPTERKVSNPNLMLGR